MYEDYFIKAIDSLRQLNKVPNLNVSYPGTVLPNGNIVYQCNTRKDQTNYDDYWISFYVIIPPTDSSLVPQQIDEEAQINGRNVSDETRIALRFAYRIFKQYKETLQKIEGYITAFKKP